MLNKISDVLKKMDKKSSIFAGVAVLVIIFGLFFSLFFSGDGFFSFAGSDATIFEREYEKLNGKLTDDDKEYPKVNISSDNVMKYSTVQEVLSIFESNGDAVVYFGYATCLYCRSAIQVLCDTAEDTELETIYYVDSSEQGDEFNQLYNVLGEELVEEENGKKTINNPLVIFIANGDVVSYNKGTLFSQTDPYIPLDDSQLKGLSGIYGYGIRDVLNSIEIKNETVG